MSLFPILDHTAVPAALRTPGLVLLDFWQLSCAPCRALEPRLERFARRRAGQFTGYRIDVDTDQNTPSSSWQEIFSFEVGDGRVGESGVDVCGAVPSDRFVRTDMVVVVAVGVDLLDQTQPVIDFFAEQPFVLQRPEAAFA